MTFCKRQPQCTHQVDALLCRQRRKFHALIGMFIRMHDRRNSLVSDDVHCNPLSARDRLHRDSMLFHDQGNLFYAVM